MTLPKFFRLLVVAAILIGAAVLLGSIGWPQPDRTREFCAVILAAILTSAFAIPRSTAEDRGMMTPPFVVDFTALLLLGGNAVKSTTTGGVMTRCLADPDGEAPRHDTGASPIRTARVHYADCWSTPAAS